MSTRGRKKSAPTTEAAGVAGFLPGVPNIGVPEIGIPDVGLPELPEFGLPDFDLPDFDLPEFGLPDLPRMPEIPLPGMPELPGFPVPEVPIPGMPRLPDFELPQIDIPEIGMPDFELPDWAKDAGEAYEQEGLDAILDPVGAMDRQNAREELADRFDIVGEDFVGPRNQNQLTAEEYEEVVRLYSDVRLGRGDLRLDASELSDADAEAFEAGAMDDIASLLQTETGRGLVRQLSDNTMVDDAGNERKFIAGMEVTGTMFEGLGSTRDRTTTLSALHQDANGDGHRHNDDQAPIDQTNGFSDPDHGNGVGVSQRNADGTRGDGSDVVIRYNPGVLLDFDSDGTPDTTTTSDIILAHEMAHARHQTQGTLASGTIQQDSVIPAGDPDIGTRNWEHQAAGLGHYANDPLTENAYRRDLNAIGRNVPQRPSYSVLP